MSDTSSNLSSSTPAPIEHPLVSIVILNWNSPEETIAAVQSLSNLDYSNFRMLLIDNGSSDRSVELLRPLVCDRVELIESKVNRGYTGGCNLGIKTALTSGADYVWLFNNDAIAPPNSLSTLVRLAEGDPAIGLVTPMIGSVETMHDATAPLHLVAHILDKNAKTVEVTDSVEVAKQALAREAQSLLAVGAALLISARLVRAIGLLDEEFFAYYEDSDYCVRALDAGFRIAFAWDTTVYHHNKDPEGAARTVKPHFFYYMARNEFRFWRKTLGKADDMRRRRWARHHQLRIFLRHQGETAAQTAILAGIWHGWIKRGGPYQASFRAPRWFEWAAEKYARLRFPHIAS